MGFKAIDEKYPGSITLELDAGKEQKLEGDKIIIDSEKYNLNDLGASTDNMYGLIIKLDSKDG
eukprot:CAMPEP_0114583852 /NCGR_PEP_ID=MMETSP0125-20121206/7529_1 /TAXON_ID=485358 ORGANISM="Aristerostoma sp., Strain ATCC 50986" /NCGR_SAMPLE_ID=MMETSP0125 /ASSEMBLY_ACC=CAM_ASM_000245 /LENGTH=62 /DNA_ID=CAMNT_0001777611 /DNA_START=348 /DNA_END=536 /DNA_ORIENTATION=+